MNASDDKPSQGKALSLAASAETQNEHRTVVLDENRLLSALDAQIKFVTESQTNEGWTRWAIWGALGGLFWIATDLMASERLVMSRAVFLAIAFFVVWILVEKIIGVLSPAARMHVGPPRFRLLSDFLSSLKQELSASGARYFVVLIALIYFRFHGVWLLWSYTILETTFIGVVFIYSVTSLALPTKLNLAAVLNIFTFVQMALLIGVGLQLLPILCEDWKRYSLEEVRLALILNAGAYLLIRLATATSSEHLLSQLTQLRQHTAFGRISIAKASEEVESLLIGLKLSDVLSPLADGIGQAMSKLQPALTAYQQMIADVEGKMTALRGNPSHEVRRTINFAEAVRKIDELDKKFVEISRELKSVKKTRSRYDLCAIVIAVYSPESRREVKAFSEQVRLEHLGTIETLGDCYKKHTALKTEVNCFNSDNKHVKYDC